MDGMELMWERIIGWAVKKKGGGGGGGGGWDWGNLIPWYGKERYWEMQCTMLGFLLGQYEYVVNSLFF